MTTETSNDQYLSRSALAERLSMSLSQLTQLLIDAGWLTQAQDKQWQLTAKGEFEGGIYRQSKNYGQYVAWPQAVMHHPIIRDRADDLLNVTTLSQFIHLPPRLLNRLLAELGWLEASAKGWNVTPLGLAYGGVQKRDDKSAVPYVMWPRKIIDSQAIRSSLDCFEENHAAALDGHHYSFSVHKVIANYLYLLGVHYSYQRSRFLESDMAVVPDFYLPGYGISIDYWSQSLSPSDLNRQLEKRAVYQQLQVFTIEVNVVDINELDQYLVKIFLQKGISLY